MKAAAESALIALSLCCSPTAHAAVTFDWATVGNPGNPADTEVMWDEGTTGYGSVDRAYRISKYEVTAEQYTEFLNAVAASDPNGLYSSDMWTSQYGCKIAQSGTDGSYTYSVAADRQDRPVNFVSFLDAMRLVNWLENGQPTGAQGPGTTEDGAYTIGDGTSEVRNPDATYFIPSEDEWYKAAYYDPASGIYYNFPTGTDDAPSHDITTPDPGNNANFHDGDYVIGSPYYMTEVGEYENSVSPYGTFDQGGNVWEWNETAQSSLWRGVRGGSSAGSAATLHAGCRGYDYLSSESGFLGFRVASIPEPASASLMLCLGAVAAMLSRRLR